MMNRVVLVGRLTKAPELRYTQSGIAVATFTLAVNKAFKKEGEPDADFINVVLWRKLAENAANYLKKGSMAGVDGRLQTRNYEGQDGKKVYVTEVLAEGVQFLDSRQKDEKQQSEPRIKNEPPKQTKVYDPFADGGQTIEIDTDSLPF